MSPFSVALRQLRAEYEIAQGEFAARLGFRQTYISQLERGIKLPKDGGLVRKIVEVLRLPPEEEATLWQAFNSSRRFDVPPPDAPAAAYRYCAQLFEALPALSSADFKALSTALHSVRNAKKPVENPDAGTVPQPEREVPM